MEKTLIKKILIMLFISLLFLSNENPVFAGGNIVKVNRIYSYQRMVSDIKALKKKYPFLVISKIGTTLEGRSIYAIRLGKGKQKVQLNASHHGREWMGTLLLMKMAETYSEAYLKGNVYQKIPVKRLLDRVSLTFIPMVNPDGVQISQYGPTPSQRSFFMKYGDIVTMPWAQWKANSQGIDPNSNYDANWPLKYDKKKMPYAEAYKGRYPGEAEEVKAMVKDTQKQKYAMAIAYHTSGNSVYWQYNQTGARAVRDNRLAIELTKITGYNLVSNEPVKQIYAGFKDWFMKTTGRPAFTIEIANPKSRGYQVPLSEFPSIWAKNSGIGLWAAKRSLELNLK